ncbi:hypothetical protein ACJJTC_006234 [Scirpophaga incertulas]
MGLPEFKTCCCFFDLKTGNLITGVINALMSFTLLVTMIVAAAMAGSVEDVVDAMSEDPEVVAAATGFYAMCIILVIMYLVEFFLDLIFIYGVTIGNTRIIKGYLIMWSALFLLSSFVFFLHIMDFGDKTIVTVLVYKGGYTLY